MFLPGRLKSTTLGDVLGSLHRSNANGQLELISDHPFQGRHTITMRDGLVCDVQTPIPVPTIGELLAKTGMLAADRHREFVACLHQQRNNKPVMSGELLVQRSFANKKQVQWGLARQSRLRIEALFTLRDAEIRFHPVSRHPQTTQLGPEAFLHGRARFRDRTNNGTNSSHRNEQPQPNCTSLHLAYRTLGLVPDASPTQVRCAFRRLASKDHPDLHMHKPESARRLHHTRFSALSEAYHAILAQQ
ncbi:MAG: DnaJ domain-containing protein [Polyangiaceae bacterium]|nr:DnaJ domain-containing protein [Polyangiaceae bacterium]